MKTVIIKILCWTAGIGIVGYIGLTVANSFPGISGLIGKVPVVGSIPTPAINAVAELAMKNSCKDDFGEDAEVVRISDAPKSEGSYHRWECVVRNPNKSDAEFQEYLEELGRYKEWPRAADYDFEKYNRTECKYYDGIFIKYKDYEGSSTTLYLCLNEYDKKYHESKLEVYEYAKAHKYVQEITDYSK